MYLTQIKIIIVYFSVKKSTFSIYIVIFHIQQSLDIDFLSQFLFNRKHKHF